MSRPLRPEFAGALYYVAARGNAREDIFRDDEDRATFLVHHAQFKTREEAGTAIFEYLEVFYDRQRLHQTLGYLSPAGSNDAPMFLKALSTKTGPAHFHPIVSRLTPLFAGRRPVSAYVRRQVADPAALAYPSHHESNDW